MTDGDLLVTSCDLCPSLEPEKECCHTIVGDPNPDRLNLCRACFEVTFGSLEEWPDDPKHVEGCGRDHDAGDGDCYTRDDFLADEGDRKYDEIKDRRFDGPDDD